MKCMSSEYLLHEFLAALLATTMVTGRPNFSCGPFSVRRLRYLGASEMTPFDDPHQYTRPANEDFGGI